MECGELSYACPTFDVPRSVSLDEKFDEGMEQTRGDLQIFAWTGAGAACSGTKQC